MNKKIVCTVVIIVALSLTVFFTITHKSNKTPSIPDTGPTTTCYTYHHKATQEAPYEVNEQLKLVISPTGISGTKNGFQSGPDMTNGYTGNLTGNQTGNIITLIYDYVVEGSANKEEEIYEMNGTSLIKHRYPLKESNGILVPDTTKTKQDLIYTKTDCSKE